MTTPVNDQVLTTMAADIPIDRRLQRLIDVLPRPGAMLAEYLNGGVLSRWFYPALRLRWWRMELALAELADATWDLRQFGELMVNYCIMLNKGDASA